MVFPIPTSLYLSAYLHKWLPCQANSEVMKVIKDSNKKRGQYKKYHWNISLIRHNQVLSNPSMLYYLDLEPVESPSHPSNFSYHVSICTKIFQFTKLTCENFAARNIVKLWYNWGEPEQAPQAQMICMMIRWSLGRLRWPWVFFSSAFFQNLFAYFIPVMDHHVCAGWAKSRENNRVNHKAQQ